MKIPSSSITLMTRIYRDVLPVVHKELSIWKYRANKIPDPELRKQALMSINQKTFHCEGGAIYAILAMEKLEESIKFIVAYQTISDYLDNLCDRSTSLDPDDFQAMHQSMCHALTPGCNLENYYRFRKEQNDGGYLHELVKTCQQALDLAPQYKLIKSHLYNLASYYCDLQVHKHVKHEERLPRLKNWFEEHKEKFPTMEWYEFSACSGSTLGIFCLVSYSYQKDFNDSMVESIYKGLFPHVQGLHILLDYFIDQEEDRLEGDLNFCSYYPDDNTLLDRFEYFMKEADRSISGIKDEKFHFLINRGLLGIYLSDNKVKNKMEIKRIAQKIIKLGGLKSHFFYINGMLFRKIKSRRA